MKINKNRILFYLFYAVLVTALVSTITLSRYSSTATGSGNVEVANIYIDGKYSSEFVVGLDNLSTTTEKYLDFEVVNFDDVNHSEVAQDYSISIKSTNNLPLTFSLINNGTTNQIESGDFVYNQSSESYQVSGGMLPIGTSRHLYTLVVTVNSKDIKYNKEIDAIELYIEAVQVKN